MSEEPAARWSLEAPAPWTVSRVGGGLYSKHRVEGVIESVAVRAARGTELAFGGCAHLCVAGRRLVRA